jgi:hypothetical protein
LLGFQPKYRQLPSMLPEMEHNYQRRSIAPPAGLPQFLWNSDSSNEWPIHQFLSCRIPRANHILLRSTYDHK